MSMGTAKSEQIKDSLGNVRYNRIPQKPLNPYVKSALLAALKQDGINIKCEASAGTNVYEVYDANGKLGLFIKALGIMDIMYCLSQIQKIQANA